MCACNRVCVDSCVDPFFIFFVTPRLQFQDKPTPWNVSAPGNCSGCGNWNGDQQRSCDVVIILLRGRRGEPRTDENSDFVWVVTDTRKYRAEGWGPGWGTQVCSPSSQAAQSCRGRCCEQEALVPGCARQPLPTAHFLTLQEFDSATVLRSQL